MEGKLHFIGIGGVGMSAIAKIMLGMGYDISGSDLQRGRFTCLLEAMGATIYYGHAAENIPMDTQAVVYSSAVKTDNPEMIEAAARGIPIYKRAETLAFLMSNKCSIGVAGSHGKTTVSAMIAVMMDNLNMNPTFAIGGMIPQFCGNSQAGEGEYFVAEADESDGTFLMLFPKIAIITNIESDHLEHYISLENIVKSFEKYLEQLPENGLAIICADCSNTLALSKRVDKHYITYALHHDADYTVTNICHNSYGVSADVWEKGQLLGRLVLNVPGEHNIANALAAVALGRYLGKDFADCAKSLADFCGTGRRFELLGRVNNLQIVDDYAHHPTEIMATIKAARDMGVKRIVTVFQPHRYSRTQCLYKEFALALADADFVVINEIYPAFEKPIPGISAQLIVDAARKNGHNMVVYAADQEQALQILNQQVRDDDFVLIMGAGNIRSVGERFLEEKLRRSYSE